ncbi:MFS transporter [Nocardia sp. ET3-3]|uniref:MFS transporter n=1 Tax=Nocardia terrae TaxID=2675851 RepID=A0A7K1V4Z6_9NOCA|nr:MFS transporter [Nocardia terrae]MVU81178.1 MFS transporter [Nocardia terrae]
MSAVTTEKTVTEASSRGAMIRTVLGIVLEYYDFAVFGIFTPFFAKQFFGGVGAIGATLSALTVFAVGFVFRPAGSIFFGWLADRRGRKAAMVIAMTVTAVGSLIIGITPTTATLGMAAVVILIVARILQGFGYGGENAAAYSYSAEIAPAKRRGLWMSFNGMALILGIMTATAIGAVLTTVLTTAQLESWGWRIPFIIGGFTGMFGLYLRRTLHESEAFTDHVSNTVEVRAETQATPMFKDLWIYRSSILRVLVMTAGITVTFYSWVVHGATNAIVSYGVDKRSAFIVALVSQALYVIATPFWGRFSDRFGRRANFLVYGISTAVFAFPALWLMGSQWWQMFIVMSISLVLLSAATAANTAFYAELFPTAVRSRGVAIPYGLGIAVFGGTAPLLDTWLHSIGLSQVFTIYALVMALGAALAAWYSPETVGRSLHDS